MIAAITARRIPSLLNPVWIAASVPQVGFLPERTKRVEPLPSASVRNGGCQADGYNYFSTAAAPKVKATFLAQQEKPQQRDGPKVSLFDNGIELGPSLVGQTAYVERTFSPESNAQAMLNCGGPALAAHASFDPNYGRAVSWIQNHAVGPAVLSPILVSGLVGALVEAAFPQAIGLKHSLQLTPDKPLIVGVAVRAEICVASVVHGNLKSALAAAATATGNVENNENDQQQKPTMKEKQMGFHVSLDTSVVRVQDGATIASGNQLIWIPDYLHM